MSSPDDSILFEHFVKLLRSISMVQPRRANNPHKSTDTPKSLHLVNCWFARIREYYPVIPPYWVKIFFRLFFPEEDVRRRYNLKETSLARCLVTEVFGLLNSTYSAGSALTQWSEYSRTVDEAKLGCLGTEVERVLSDRHSTRRGMSPSLQKIDSLLDELAALSAYSNLGIVPSHPRRRRAAILKDLYLDLEPVEAKFLTQIILKDLRPVLYPLTEKHTTRALLHYKSNAVHVLTKWEVMHAWHPCMPRIYRARATLDEAANAVDTLPMTTHAPWDHESFTPAVGIPVEIPKSQKGVKISHALRFLRDQNAGDVWAETKIFIPVITQDANSYRSFAAILSANCHTKQNIIRAALGLPISTKDHSRYPTLQGRVNGLPACTFLSMILDAEMVCYSESKGEIDEFWRIRSLVESTAHGVRGARYYDQRITRLPDTQDSRESCLEESQEITLGSLQSNASDNGDRHLKLVFFDVLFLDGISLLDRPYDERRAQLERLVHVIPGYVSLSSRRRISFSRGFPIAIETLAQIFSEHIAKYQEGLVLKASKSHYNSVSHPWVKLKRDYIPGYGDTVDLVVLGAGWNKARARELRVTPETFTTFYVSALLKAADVTLCIPQFQILFTVEYGMDREQLETFNMYIKTSNPQPFAEEVSSDISHAMFKIPALSYGFRLPRGLTKPAVLLSRPLLAELFGAGFTKHAGAKDYSLRFPRMTKVWWANERNWAQGSNLEEFQSIARSSIGRESDDDWASRNVDVMWGCRAAPGPKDPQKVAESIVQWRKRLRDLEGLDNGGTDSRVCSSARRKAPVQDIRESSPKKRRRLETDRITLQPLKALGSMTNMMRAYAKARRPRQLTKMTPPATPADLSWSQGGQHKGQERRVYTTVRDKGCASIKGTTQHVPIIPISPDRPPPPQPTPTTSPVSMNFSLTDGHPETLATSNQQTDAVMFLAQLPCMGRPLTPAISLPSAPSTRGRTQERVDDVAVARFPAPYWPQRFIHTAMGQFLQDAYVWIPSDKNNKRPTDRPPASEIVPQNRRIAVIYFLLIICGARLDDWPQSSAEQFANVNKCVLFVKTGAEVQHGLDWLFGALETWRTELNRAGRKELIVLDAEMITYQSLATFWGDVASHALWRSSRKTE